MPVGIDEAYYGFQADAPMWDIGDFALFVGDTVQGRSDSPNDADSYYINLLGGLTYTITATSSFGPPPQFSIDNIFIFPIAFSKVEGNTSTVTLMGDQVPDAGFLTIIGKPSTIYTATLTVSGANENAGNGENVVLQANTAASLDFWSDSDRFTLNAIAGHTYHLTVETELPDMVARVSLPQATGALPVPLIDMGDGMFTFTPNIDGAFEVSFRSKTFRSEGDYTFVVADITAPNGNLAPVADAMVQNFRVLNNATRAIVVNARDAEGDEIFYSVSAPQHGSVERDTEGRFIYTADADYHGMDQFEVTLTDPDGATSIVQVNLFVIDAVTGEGWRLLAGQNFSGEIAGYGSIFGTSGIDDITVLREWGNITFDPSFNAGGDFIRLPGNAEDWEAVRVGSAIVLTNVDIVVNIPVGIDGVTIGFEDGSAALRYDPGSQNIVLGDQAITTSLETLDAEAIDGPVLADPAVTDTTSRILFNGNGSATIGGNFDVFGDNRNGVNVTHGVITLDPSFNEGYDSINIVGDVVDFTVRLFGSSVILESDTTSVTTPISPNEIFIQVGNAGDIMFLDLDAGKVFIGSQEITAMEMPLTFA